MATAYRTKTGLTIQEESSESCPHCGQRALSPYERVLATTCTCEQCGVEFVPKDILRVNPYVDAAYVECPKCHLEVAVFGIFGLVLIP